MWISNTATTIMMLPIALSVLNVVKVSPEVENRMSFILLVGVAWSANIGGMMTLIGTPPNLIFAGFLKEQLHTEIAFSHWLIIGLPAGITLLLAAYSFLSRFVPKVLLFNEHNVIQDELTKLGKMSLQEKRVTVVFVSTALAWILRPFVVSHFSLEGLSDTTIALVCAIVLFVLPGTKKERLLKWSDTSKLAWGILVLFGGGLALAGAIKSSGIIDLIEVYLSALEVSNVIVLIAIMTLIGIFVTEFVSNMALVAATLPLVYAVSSSMNVDFELLALPLTLGASCAFMLPMATPPNAIVFSSGKIRIEKMARFGLVMNVFAFIILTGLAYLLGSYVL
jgi:sodium-dependent dicarboxylate transporter 2/3/5